MDGAVGRVRRGMTTAVLVVLIVAASTVGLHEWADEHLTTPSSIDEA